MFWRVVVNRWSSAKRFRSRGWQLAAGGAITIAVALAAIGGWSVSPVSAAGCPQGFKSFIQGAPSESLLSILGVLRRPATPADALPPQMNQFLGMIDKSRGVEVFEHYVRRVDGYFMWPERFAGCGLGLGSGSADAGRENMVLSDGSGWGGAGDAAAIEQGAALAGGTSSFGSSTVEGLVPDGVATITLRYPAGKIGGFDKQDAPAFKVTVKIVGNLMVATIPRGGNRLTAPMTMLWQAANGTTIKTFHRL
jgi:hypothetical protein